MRRYVVATLLVLAVAGCSEDPAPENPATDPATASRPAESTGAASPGGEITAEQAQMLVQDALLADDVVGLAPIEAESGSGLDAPTFSGCDAAGTGGDELRVARVQRWWSNEEYDLGQPGALRVGDEVVYYRDGGVDELLAGLGMLPEVCAEGVTAGEGTYTFQAAPQPAGLPSTAAAVHVTRTFTSGASDQGYIIAVPDGDLASILYIFGDTIATVDAQIGDLISQVGQEMAGALEG